MTAPKQIQYHFRTHGLLVAGLLSGRVKLRESETIFAQLNHDSSPAES